MSEAQHDEDIQVEFIEERTARFASRFEAACVPLVDRPEMLIGIR